MRPGDHHKPSPSLGCALDDLVIFPTARKELRKAQKTNHQLHELRRILGRLRQCCRMPTFRWPAEEDLGQLDELVSELVPHIRKKTSRVLWRNYKAVDDHWHLNLCKTLTDLIDRTEQLTPVRPLESYDRLLRRKKLNLKVKQFFILYDEVLKGRDPATIRWEELDDVFRAARPDNISISIPINSRKRSVGSPGLVAYTVFLELFCDDARWMRRHWKGVFTLITWVATSLQNFAIASKLRRFLIPNSSGRSLVHFLRNLPRKLKQKKVAARRAGDALLKRQKKLRGN